MNTDNNNLENNIGTENLGTMQTPVNPEPINNPGGDSFSPFQDLNSAPLNVPQEGVESASSPVSESAVSFDEFTQGTPAPAPSFDSAPVQEPVSAPSPVAPAMPDAAPGFDATPASNDFAQPSFETNQAAPTMENLEAPQYSAPQAPVMDAPAEPLVENPAPAAGIQDTINQNTGLNDALQTEPVVEGPTIPIPDSMPTNDYQATVSTPVDYATPMSDFDQIGTTPDLDPKAKGDKKKNKGLLLILLLLVIGGLGAGSYYLINIKGIFNSESVITKEVTIEKDDTSISVNIEDYATFKNTSSANCVLDTSKVDVANVGSYEFTITCGDKSYTGTAKVVDTNAPDVEFKTVIVTAGGTLPVEGLIGTTNETATYKYVNETEVVSQLSSAGLKNVDVTVSDNANNSRTYKAPVIVTSAEYSFAIIAKKNVSGDDTNANVIEKNVILYNSTAGIVNDTGYTAYIITFNDNDSYKTAIKGYDDSGVLNYSTYTGLPVFYSSSNTLVLVKDLNSDLIKDTFNDTYASLKESLGYEVATSQSGNLDPLIYNK